MPACPRWPYPVRSTGEHLVETALHLLLGERLDELRDDPDVAEGVLDASSPVSIELDVHGDEHLGPRPFGRFHRRIRVLDFEREPHRRSAERERLRGAEIGVVLGHHDGGGPDPELGVDDAPVRGGEPGAALDGAECPGVEIERSGRVDDGDVGGDGMLGHGDAPRVWERAGESAPRFSLVSLPGCEGAARRRRAEWLRNSGRIPTDPESRAYPIRSPAGLSFPLVGPERAPYQPSQRYLVLDERRVEEDDLPSRNLMAAVVGLERSRSLADPVRVVEALQEWLPDPRDAELKSAFAEWVRRLAKRLAPAGGEALPPARTLEDVRMNLEERVAQWPKEWLVQGIEQGFEQGLEHERALLCRMAGSRFGADTSEQLSTVLAGVADQARFADIGDRLVRCDTGQEFLARAASAANEPERPRG